MPDRLTGDEVGMEVGYLAVGQPRCSVADMCRPQLLPPHQRLAAGQEAGRARTEKNCARVGQVASDGFMPVKHAAAG